MSQKLPVNNFEWIEDFSQLNKDFKKKKDCKKDMMKILMKDIFSKFMFNILKNSMSFTMVYHFYLFYHFYMKG